MTAPKILQKTHISTEFTPARTAQPCDQRNAEISKKKKKKYSVTGAKTVCH